MGQQIVKRKFYPGKSKPAGEGGCSSKRQNKNGTLSNTMLAGKGGYSSDWLNRNGAPNKGKLMRGKNGTTKSHPKHRYDRKEGAMGCGNKQQQAECWQNKPSLWRARLPRREGDVTQEESKMAMQQSRTSKEGGNNRWDTQNGSRKKRCVCKLLAGKQTADNEHSPQ